MSKLKNLTNKELIESAFNQIERDTGFHIINKNYHSSYFIFEDEKDSICNFHIKEIPGFIFSFWNTNRFDKIEDLMKRGTGLTWADSLEVDHRSELIFFTQYERDLDKFKPTRSGFVTGIFRQAYEEQENGKELVFKEEWDYMYKICEILRYMKKHPVKSYYYVMTQNNYIYEEISGIKCLKIFIDDWFYDKKYKLKDFIKFEYLLHKSINLFKRLKNINVIISNYNNCYPKIHIKYRRKSNIDINSKELAYEYSLIDKFIEKYEYLLIFTEMEYVLFKSDLAELPKTEIKHYKNADRKLAKKFYKFPKFAEKDSDIKIIYKNF